MCAIFEVETESGFVECMNYGELRAVVRVALYDECDGADDRECLCCVNASKTAELNGMTHESDGFHDILRLRREQ